MADASRDLVRQDLQAILTKIPTSISQGSWNLSADFKRSVSKAHRALSNSRATKGSLLEALHELRSYHK